MKLDLDIRPEHEDAVRQYLSELGYDLPEPKQADDPQPETPLERRPDKGDSFRQLLHSRLNPS